MEKMKKFLLGVRNSKKKNNSKVQKFANYLKSDYYMFAPLMSADPPTSVSAAPKIVTGFTVKEPSKSKKKKRQLLKIGEFLKFDSHMYGPVLAREKFRTSRQGRLQHTNRVTMEASKRTIVMEDEQTNLQPPNATGKVIFSKNSRTETSTSHRQRVGSGSNETVRHVFRPNCRSSSTPGRGFELDFDSTRKIQLEISDLI